MKACPKNTKTEKCEEMRKMSKKNMEKMRKMSDMRRMSKKKCGKIKKSEKVKNLFFPKTYFASFSLALLVCWESSFGKILNCSTESMLP